jgi:hypothetical protein
MKKLLLASVFAIVATTSANAWTDARGHWFEGPVGPYGDLPVGRRFEAPPAIPNYVADQQPEEEAPPEHPPARVTVPPPYSGPPSIGWVYGPYTQCANPPQCSMGVVNVQADGLNVRVTPNGASPAVMALVNGTPLYPIKREGDWLLVAAGCDLTPTFAWSWSAGVPLNRCWVYF